MSRNVVADRVRCGVVCVCVCRVWKALVYSTSPNSQSNQIKEPGHNKNENHYSSDSTQREKVWVVGVGGIRNIKRVTVNLKRTWIIRIFGEQSCLLKYNICYTHLSLVSSYNKIYHIVLEEHFHTQKIQKHCRPSYMQYIHHFSENH